MMHSRLLFLLLLSSSLISASSLSVYQDKTFYKTTLQNNFIGFGQGIGAKCEDRTVELYATSICPSDERLCRLLMRLKDTEQKLSSVEANKNVLEKLISLPRPTTYDAGAWIEAAQNIGNEQSRLDTKEKLLREELLLQNSNFKKQAPQKKALMSRKLCAGELELTIPYGYVSFNTLYEVDLSNVDTLNVTQYLSIKNHSGVDIKADEASFYYRRAQQYVQPIHFTPWIVGKYTPKPKKILSRTKVASAYKANVSVLEEMAGDFAATPEASPIARYEDAREYKIKSLSLPSTGVPVDVPVVKWNESYECMLRSFPYRNQKVFEVCSFKPKYQIENNHWKVKKDSEVINDNAMGEYRDQKYHIYTKVDDDILVLRKGLVQKERTSGIFGSTVRKKDGFVLVFANKSDKVKSIIVTERIPISTTEEIKVKLLEISSKNKVEHSMKKEGELEMKLDLAPYERKEIKILFEMSYDKELKIEY